RWVDVSYEGEETIKLVPDKKSYRPGETAHVLALLPTEGAHLLVTTELRNVMSVQRVDSVGRMATIRVPIEKTHAPNIFLGVSYVRGGDLHTASVELVVPARDKLLKLDIIPNKKEFRPRETASYTLLARNSDGSPAAGAEVSFGVVDEAVYSISPESVEDIRRAFYGRRYNEVSTSFSVNFHFTGYAGNKPMKLAANRKPNNLADFKNDDTVNPRVRKLFKDTAFWQPSIVTGADGRANVKVELPDNLTTWRATARAVTADTKVGVAVGKVVARKDLILRIAMPRFLTQGDTATLSAVVHNYLKSEKTTQISLDIRGGRLLDPPAQTVTIPSQGEHRVNWRVAVPDTGELVILGKALTDTESDAVEAPLPVVPRGLKETRGQTAALPEEDVEKRFVFQLPPNADQNARSLRLEFTPTIAGTLFGALDYLSTFPYGCTEQTMSSFLPNVIVAQTLKTVESASVKDEDKLDLRVRRGLRRLYAYQHTDGGWGWWKDDQTDAFMTAYVVDGLTQAKRAGYEVDDARLDRARERLRALLDEQRELDKPGALEARAYMVYALASSGESDARYATELFGARGKLQPYGRALLALTLLERGDKNRALAVAAEIERTAAADESGARWQSRNYSHGQFEYSNDVEATALSVKALARLLPQSELLPRAARWLVMSRKFGRFWVSTKETAFAIFGLTDYLKASQELDADFALEVYLNGQQVLAQQVTAADASAAKVFDVVRRGAEVGRSDEVRVVKRGRGVLYFSSTLTYHTNDEQTAAQGSPQLSLSREYLRLRLVPGENSTLKWQTEPLSGDLRSGDLLVSRLRVQGQPGSYLLVEDPIPAGCEQIEAVGMLNFNHAEKEWSSWYSAREFRDQRTALFLSFFDGTAMYQTAMRVQVPGQFRVAPARVEQMYQPSVRANSASAALTILDNK
ncbi:MAG TPA: alpha-2-macroglobulin family protein, partial [Pyrinomonadaceae bacterium]|nr:alpha-2-macroglobulin family protein [Pyrinomonadaceae bacterium]